MKPSLLRRCVATRGNVKECVTEKQLAGVVSSISVFCHQVQQVLDSAAFTQKRHLVELLIDRVIVTDEEVEIRYVIPTASSSEHIRFCQLLTDYRSAKYA